LLAIEIFSVAVMIAAVGVGVGVWVSGDLTLVAAAPLR
jgi:EamA domain-containing membrane protein RarD